MVTRKEVFDRFNEYKEEQDVYYTKCINDTISKIDKNLKSCIPSVGILFDISYCKDSASKVLKEYAKEFLVVCDC